MIKRLARIADISFADAPPQGAVQLLVRGDIAALPLKGVIDLAAEKSRLEKELAKVAADIARVDAKLGNADFRRPRARGGGRGRAREARGGGGAPGQDQRGAGAAEIGRVIFALCAARGAIRSPPDCDQTKLHARICTPRARWLLSKKAAAVADMIVSRV